MPTEIIIPSELTIDRSRWVNGDNCSYNGYNDMLVNNLGGRSKLLNDKGNMCCVGFLGKACGLSDDQINGMGTLINFNAYGAIRDLEMKIRENDIYSTNDARMANPEFEREALLIEKFANIGIKVTFVGEAIPIGEKK